MKRFPIIGAMLLMPALGLLLLVGCTNTKKDDKTTPADSSKQNQGGDKTLVKLKGATEGKISGTVKIKGEKPEMKPQPGIEKHGDKDYCLAGGKVDPKHVLEQTWLIGKDGGVENVVIWIAAPEGKEYDVVDKLKEPFKTKTYVLDQPYCQYTPHMIALYADVQPLHVKNSAKVVHNVKIAGGIKNGDSNDTMQPQTELKPRTFKKDANPIPVSCQMHTWMTAKIHTFDHPYFAVTDKDGKFTIENVPVGDELVVFMYHEAKGKQEAKKATFKTGDNTLDLEIAAK
jgi:hypothetical protein